MKEIGHAEIKPLTLEIVWLEIKRERNQLCKPALLTLGTHTPVYLIPTQGRCSFPSCHSQSHWK